MSHTPRTQPKYSSKPVEALQAPSSCRASAWLSAASVFQKGACATSGALVFVAATQGAPLDCRALVTREADICGSCRTLTEKEPLTGHTPGHSTEAAV